MRDHDEFVEPEEPWEAEIGALFGGLPAVDPPEGFIASALNHRPLYAGRIMTASLAVLLAVVAASLAVGATGGSLVTPEIDRFAQRHLQAEANLIVAVDGGLADNDAGTAESEEPVAFVPDGYQRTATIDVDDLRQAVYEREGESVSVFIQQGEVDWAALPDGGHTILGGNPAWVDRGQSMTVIQAGAETITVIGLAPIEVSDLVSSLPPREEGMVERAQELVSTLVGQFGFPHD